MKSKILWWILGALGIFFLLSSLAITFVEYNRYKTQTAGVFPAGSTVASVPVGGLNAAEAEARLSDYYNLPLDLEIEGSTLAAAPADLGFTFDPTALVRTSLDQVGKGGFWAALWNKTEAKPISVPLDATVDQNTLRAYLNKEIAPRYTQPGNPLTPIANTTNFDLSTSGSRLDIDLAVTDITAALFSPDVHRVSLQVTAETGMESGWSTLEAFLKHNINWTGFDGIVEVYLQSMADGQSLHFAVWDGETVPPDIAFTAASTIKIPIMISVLRRLEEPIPETVVGLMEEMIINSENSAADTLMQYYLDEVRGPLIVSEDMQTLGLENTFLAGYFYFDAPLLQIFDTPANARTDIDLDPDLYNQMTPAELARLMVGIYHCAKDGSGMLTETFPGEITQGKCQLMIDIMEELKPLQFMDTTLPPDTILADKYGYVTELDGLLHSITDVGIVYTPGGDFVLGVSVYHPDWLYANDGQRVIGRLSQTVYNFFNPNNQAYWWYD